MEFCGGTFLKEKYKKLEFWSDGGSREGLDINMQRLVNRSCDTNDGFGKDLIFKTCFGQSVWGKY